nr:phenylacetate--CoA ligase family protein [Acidimicrobiia bacterium]
ARLVAHAAARSPYYGRVLRGLEGAALADLPVLTKDNLVERFDELTIDRSLHRTEIETFLQSAPAKARYRGRYRVAASSGSSGRPGIVVFDAAEWAGLLAASVASRALAGSPSGRSAKVGSPSPWHLSAQLGATLEDPRRPALRLPVTTALPELLAALDRFGPAVLTAYPSVLGMLAEAQRAGQLHLALTHVFGGGEVLTAATRRRVSEVWGAAVFDQYVTTEAGAIAGGCPAEDGMHVIDDHVIVEVVDERRRPAPAGTFGAAVLVTVLSSRTLPLIRYELADHLRLALDPCACGRPGPRIAAIAGREREVLRLAGPGGPVAVHPAVLTSVLDVAPVAGWQVHQQGPRLRVLVVGPAAGFAADDLGRAVLAALTEMGVTEVDVDVEVVDIVPRRAGGKAARFVVDGPT